MRTVVCSLHHGIETPMTQDSARNHLAYSLAHGYSYVRVAGSIDVSRPPSWSKVLLLLNLMQQYDWLLWMDTDAVFVKDASPARTIFGAAQDAVSQIWAFEQPYCRSINGGVLLVRAGKVAADLFWTLYQQQWTAYCPWWEQEAMNHYWEGVPGVNRLLAGCRFPDAEELKHPSAMETAAIFHAYGPHKAWLARPEIRAQYLNWL